MFRYLKKPTKEKRNVYYEALINVSLSYIKILISCHKPTKKVRNKRFVKRNKNTFTPRSFNSVLQKKNETFIMKR